MVRLALPTGSLEETVLALFRAADLPVRRSAPRALRAQVGYPGVAGAEFHKAREIPPLVENGSVDAGITGSEWIEETGAKVDVVGGLAPAGIGSRRWRLVLAAAEGGPASSVGDLDGARVATEYPAITRRFLRDHGVRAEIVRSYGATEAKVPHLAEAIVDVVETGESLRQNGLRALATVRVCGLQVVASREVLVDESRRAVVAGMVSLLDAAHAAREHRLLTVLVPVERLPEVEALLPARRWRLDRGGSRPEGTVAVQAVCEVEGIAAAVSALRAAGAAAVVETAIHRLVTA
ncbi:MAG TPA: ATP phosphoribosyltransferase [Pseudonocardia sp.]|nr:ATP phosphoribosyltransferase [Pseudonocardia sp.]